VNRLFETSASTGVGVVEAFETLFDGILDRLESLSKS
jgi:hypothetical protein